jgi:hypothetical protein
MGNIPRLTSEEAISPSSSSSDLLDANQYRFLHEEILSSYRFLLSVKDAAVYCNRMALKNFCRLLADHEESDFDIMRYFSPNGWMPIEAILRLSAV